jgi:hypothetical protein
MSQPQTIDFSKSGSTVTAIAVGDYSFNVQKFPQKFKFHYDGLGNIITEIVPNPNEKLYCICKIIDVSFEGVKCVSYADCEAKIKAMFFEDLVGGGGSGVGYNSYSAFLSKTGATDPTALILKNDLPGTIVWTRQSPGVYVGTLAGAFTLGKTWCSPKSGEYGFNFRPLDNDRVQITLDNDDDIIDQSIEIRVYS